jgi:hypothetical protein
MSSLEQRIASVTEKRLAVIAATAAKFKARLCELEELRDQVRKAQLSRPRSHKPTSAERRGEARA